MFSLSSINPMMPPSSTSSTMSMTTTLTPPSLNVTPAEPILTRPKQSRSATDVDMRGTTQSSTYSLFYLTPPQLKRRLTSLVNLDRSTTTTTTSSSGSSSSSSHCSGRLSTTSNSSTSTTSQTATTTNYPSSSPRLHGLLSYNKHHHHHRSLSSQPILLQISSTILSRSDQLSAETLLQRALEDDLLARSPDLSPLVSLTSPEDNHSIDPPPHLADSASSLDPVLADLEAKSIFNVQTECAICQKKGINFPKCPKCQLEFCSRACRVSMGDGERHKCA